MRRTYIAPRLTNQGAVVATTLGILSDVSIENPAVAGQGTRKASSGETELTDFENTFGASESKASWGH
jgi:hypothetical protein